MSHEFVNKMRRWDVIAGLCQAIDARTYVEVGCKDGRTTGHVLSECPHLRAIAIDPWCQQESGGDATRETYEKWDFKEIERLFWENAGANKDRCKMLRASSLEAACGYFEQRTAPPGLAPDIHGLGFDYQPTPSADVVFIDALHDYESVKQDIALWWPLVREGGYLAGHDFNHKWPGVMRAVAEAFPLFKVRLAPDSVWFVRKETLAVAA